jgi:hypothetical protein
VYFILGLSSLFISLVAVSLCAGHYLREGRDSFDLGLVSLAPPLIVIPLFSIIETNLKGCSEGEIL